MSERSEVPLVYTPHLDSAYERELREVTALVNRMGEHARKMVSDACRSLLQQDQAAAQAVIEADGALDAMEIQCDQLCVALMARRAPVGSDLRLVTSVLKLVTDLERIGDLAVNIAKRGMQVGGSEVIPAEVAELAQAAQEELGHALIAFATRDVELARRLQVEDSSTDARNRAAFDRLINASREGAQGFDELLAVTSACRHLERIGDHAVNVAEMVVYMVEGKVVRHRCEN